MQKARKHKDCIRDCPLVLLTRVRINHGVGFLHDQLQEKDNMARATHIIPGTNKYDPILEYIYRHLQRGVLAGLPHTTSLGFQTGHHDRRVLGGSWQIFHIVEVC